MFSVRVVSLSSLVPILKRQGSLIPVPYIVSVHREGTGRATAIVTALTLKQHETRCQCRKMFLYSDVCFRSIQSAPSHSVTIISILILSWYLRLGHLDDTVTSDFPIKIMFVFLISPWQLHASPTYYLHLTFKMVFVECLLWSSSLRIFLNPLAFPSLIVANLDSTISQWLLDFFYHAPLYH
jgi:hypothetical protein